MTPALLTETAFVLHRLLTFERPADAVLSAYFRDKGKLGARDRAFIAEAAYGVLRRLRTLEHLAGGREPRRLLLAWLARFGGHNLRQFDGLTRGDEGEWLKQVKSVALDALAEAEVGSRPIQPAPGM
jgi:16S rRNA (cytosine967-C5)-methyltransferase